MPLMHERLCRHDAEMHSQRALPSTPATAARCVFMPGKSSARAGAPQSGSAPSDQTWLHLHGRPTGLGLMGRTTTPPSTAFWRQRLYPKGLPLMA